MGLAEHLAAGLALVAPVMLLASAAGAAERPARIDRHALVARHNIEWNEPAGQIPLGNGEFCASVDATGLQTFGGNTMSHWAWHSVPLPAGCTLADVPALPGLSKHTGRIVLLRGGTTVVGAPPRVPPVVWRDADGNWRQHADHP